jgi:hypothetical protein
MEARICILLCKSLMQAIVCIQFNMDNEFIEKNSLVVPTRISLIEGCGSQESYWTNGSSWLSWSHHFESFTVDLDNLYGICATNDHGDVPLVLNTSRSFPHSWLITRFVTRITRQVPLVEQELLTLLEHLSSSPVFSGVPVTRSLVLLYVL